MSFKTIAPRADAVTDALNQMFLAENGPLHVVLAPGIHRCGGLRLRSDITIELQEGAELHFIADYDAYAETTVAIVAEESDRAMMTAVGEKNIRLTGKGRIFCDGAAGYSLGEDGEMGTLVAQKHRPRILVLDRCRDIVIEGLQIHDSPMWTMHFADCDNISVRNVHVDNNRRMPNTDGIVIDGCRNVEIIDSVFRTADDGIVLKTTRREDGSLTGACADISVKDCVIESRSCALKIGTESFSAFRNITFEDVRIEKSNRGLGIFSRDGGVVENIRFKRIVVDCQETPAGFWGSGEAVTITVLDRRPEERPAGRVSDVVVEDVSGSMEGAINLVAEHEGDITDVTLKNISIDQRSGPLGTGLSYDIRPTIDDRFDRFPVGDKSAGRVNAWRYGPDGKILGLIPYETGMPGVFAKGVTGLVIEDVNVSRPAQLPQGWCADAVVRISTEKRHSSTGS